MPSADLSELLMQWEDARDEGRDLRPEHLCRRCPELLPELRQRIAALEAMNPLLRMNGRPAQTLLLGADLGPSAELTRLLRGRLRVAGSIFVLACLLSLLLAAFNVEYRAGFRALDFLPVAGTVAAVGGLLLPLFGKRALSLRYLRTTEVLTFGLAAALVVWEQVHFFRTDWLDGFVGAGDGGAKLALLLIDSLSIPWILLIVLYGTFIPNTWRRCALAVGLLWAAALLVAAYVGVTDARVGADLLRYGLPALAVGLAVPGAIAVYGSYKISALQREAQEARKLGQYRLTRRLGSGGMGEVYLAEHQLLRRPCAIKLIRPDRAGDGRALRRFEREVRAMATLTHWNAVEIFDYGHGEDGTFYYVMEYLPGLTLEQVVHRDGPLPPARVVHLLRQVCGALAEAHDIGLIHRDIKPGNIIVCERGGVHDVAKLLDFGLVKPAQESLNATANKLTIEGVVAGTPLYMSPEQAAVSHKLDRRSDLCSLGSVAYFLLCGQPPFVRETVMQLFAAHMHDPVSPLRQVRPDVPDDLEAVVMRCLEKDPADRFPDARSLERALAACACADRWTQAEAAAWWGRHQAAVRDVSRAGAETSPPVGTR